MGRPQVSFAKRQREQAKRERKQMKAEKRAERKNEVGPDGTDSMIATDELVAETKLTPEELKEVDGV